MKWRVRGREFLLGNGCRPLIMGILNVAPDSFSVGGRYAEARAAVERAVAMLDEGADIIDIGGESSRPGAEPVSEADEIKRVVPVIEGLLARRKASVSVDTTKARVAQAALSAGAVIINDISAFRFDAAMPETAAKSGAGVVLMHMLGEPGTMQKDPRYADVVSEIGAFLRERGEAAAAEGVAEDAIVYDPGIGFGKTPEHNLEIIRRLAEFKALGRPILLGPSRKSFIGHVLGGLPPAERLEGTAAAIALGIANGAAILRVHDVREMARAAAVAAAIRGAGA